MLAGISSYTFPWSVSTEKDIAGKRRSVYRLLQEAIDNDIHFVQFGDNLPLEIFSDGDIDEIKNRASATGISLQIGTRKLTLENTRRYIQLARKLSSPFVRMVIDDNDYHPGEEEVVAIIRQLLPDLRENKTVLAIENHDRFTAAMLEAIIQKTDKQLVGVCLDTANSLGAGEGIGQVAGVLAPYTVNLHIKDFTITRLSHKMGFIVEGAPAGEGLLDIKRLIDQIRQYHRCETATLEIWSGNLETLEKTIQREREWADKSIRYLKTIIA